MENADDLMRVCSDKVAKLLTKKRKQTRLTQAMLAKKLGISRAAITKRESEGTRDLAEILKHLRMLESDPRESLLDLINQIAMK